MINNMSSKTLLFAAVAAIALASGCSRPIAQFSYDGGGKAPSSIRFENKSQKATAYEWSFGDGKPLPRPSLYTATPLPALIQSFSKPPTAKNIA